MSTVLSDSFGAHRCAEILGFQKMAAQRLCLGLWCPNTGITKNTSENKGTKNQTVAATAAVPLLLLLRLLLLLLLPLCRCVAVPPIGFVGASS